MNDSVNNPKINLSKYTKMTKTYFSFNYKKNFTLNNYIQIYRKIISYAVSSYKKPSKII